MITKQVPTGFEAAHVEWLRIGGQTFRKLHQIGPRPDFYRSNYWKLVKQAVLASKAFKCCRCNGNANQVHHLNYDRVGEDHLYPETLVAICTPCHGLVEYARKAEALISRISRRISLCKGFLEDRRGCLDQNATHVLARLLEYQDELAALQKLFANKTYYGNTRIKDDAAVEIVVARFEQKRLAYEGQAAHLVSTWHGNEKEKAERLLPMLELEIQNCRKFVAEVFAPVMPRAERQPVEAALESESAKRRGESLVVGIKFHRGHINGIAEGDNVQLVREPNNAYDPNAIRVNLQTGETLGYLTREFAATLVRQIDGSVCVQSHISRIVRDKVYIAVVLGKI